MAINLQQHGTEMLNAFNSVLNPNDATNWVIFSYEGKSNVLKLGETGDGGLEELSTAFNSGKVQYAVTTVECPATKQPKVLLIQWQGEGVPATQLGTTASHVHEVKRFFKGIHITIHARSDDDVEPDVILKAVHKVTSTLTSSASQGFVDAQPTPVGSVYKRTMPKQDINSSSREQFWTQVEKDDAARRNDEQSRLKAVNDELENDRKLLADRIHIKQQETTAQYLEGQRQARNPSDQSRHERLADAREAIGNKSANLKSMWEEKGRPAKDIPTSPPPKAPISSLPKAPAAPPPKAPASSPPKAPTGYVPHLPSHRPPSPPPAAQHDTQWEEEEQHDEQPSYYEHQPEKKTPMVPPPAPKYEPPQEKPTPKYVQPAAPPPAPMAAAPFVRPPRPQDSDEEEEQNWDDDDTAPPPQMRADSTTDHSQVIRKSGDSDAYDHIPEHDQHEQSPLPKPKPGKGTQAVALWDYQATDDTELTFDPNDVICHIEQVDPGWWRGEGPDGRVGLFPANYVQLLE